ncbi:MAG: ATP-dependent helicase, partial [Thaumarchaeota archaeon]|nr:ATP-dependent helicase [Nitrososphaerota archaeon]
DRLDVKNFVDECFEWFEQRQNEEPAPDYDTEYMDERRIWNGIISDITNTGHEDMTLSVLLQQIELSTKESPAPKDSIPCYTIFVSKGMEFHHVYLIRLTEGDLPDWRAIKNGDHNHEMYEERRICFVAITRAQKSLTLTYPQNVSGSTKESSRFLAEMGAVAYP